jgi:hypothetical protein
MRRMGGAPPATATQRWQPPQPPRWAESSLCTEGGPTRTGNGQGAAFDSPTVRRGTITRALDEKEQKRQREAQDAIARETELERRSWYAQHSV